MPKATLVLPDGTNVTVEGSEKEVARLMAFYTGKAQPDSGKGAGKDSGREAASAKKKSAPPKGSGPRYLVYQLANEGFFDKEKTLVEVQQRLEEEGHIYAQTSLSAPLLHAVQSKWLRRVRGKDGWVYIKR
jgi:hypothetical protein